MTVADMSFKGRKVSVAVALVTVVAIPVGLGLSIFGFYGWCVGPAVIVAGLAGRSPRHRWAPWAMWIGIGLTVGALAYITLGLLTPDGPSSDGGSAPPPN